MSLPRFMVLRSNATGKFLCYGKDKGGPTLSFSQEIKLPAAADQLLEPKKRSRGAAQSEPDVHFLKFEVEEAKSAPGLVHIRTCYNNKYWVRKSVECNKIVAEAHEPEEDQSKWCSTLFKPIFLGDADEEATKDSVFGNNKHGYGKPPQQIQLMHVSQLGQLYTSDINDHHLALGSSDDATAAAAAFTAFDVEPTAILPGYITLMGKDGKYLARYGDGGLLLGFVTSDMSDIGVAMWTTQLTSPGYTSIMIKGTDLAWNLNTEKNNRVELEHSRANALFAGVKDGDYVALLCQSDNNNNNNNNNFLERVTGTGGLSDGLQADTPTITEEATLKVGEPVTAREILSATYDLEHSRVYDTITVEKYKESISNYTSVVQNEVFEVVYAPHSTMTWNQSLTVNVGIPATWSYGIPKVGSDSDSDSDSGVHVSSGRDLTCEWGKELTDKMRVTAPVKIAIPPKKQVTVRIVATRSYCDVPFTCEVRDTMTDKTPREYTKKDGLFTGCNDYNIMHSISMEDL